MLYCDPDSAEVQTGERVRIAPRLMDLPDLRGVVGTPKGPVRFDCRRENGVWRCRLTLPEGLDGVFVRPDGGEEPLSGGKEQELSF